MRPNKCLNKRSMCPEFTIFPHKFFSGKFTRFSDGIFRSLNKKIPLGRSFVASTLLFVSVTVYEN